MIHMYHVICTYIYMYTYDTCMYVCRAGVLLLLYSCCCVVEIDMLYVAYTAAISRQGVWQLCSTAAQQRWIYPVYYCCTYMYHVGK